MSKNDFTLCYVKNHRSSAGRCNTCITPEVSGTASFVHPVLWRSSSPECVQALEQTPQGSGHGTELAGVQEECWQHLQTQSNFCVVLGGARSWT